MVAPPAMDGEIPQPNLENPSKAPLPPAFGQKENPSFPPVSGPPYPFNPGGPPAPNFQSGPPPGWNPPAGPPLYPFNGPVQPEKVPVASNGLPLPVMGNPEGYFSFTNQDKKKVYTAYAPLSKRLGASLIDTFLGSIVFFTIFAIYLLFQPQSELEGLSKSLQNPDAAYTSTPIVLVNWLFGGGLLIYDTLFLTLLKGQTLGKKILGIKVIQMNGLAPEFKTALLRSSFGFSWFLASILAPFGAIFSAVSLGLQLMVLFGFARIINNKKRQGWHDKLAETLVVSSKELVQGVNY